MPPKPKYATEEERKAAQKAQRKAYEARNPEILKAKRQREKLKGRSTRNTDTRVCKKCSIDQDMEQFPKHGKGRLYECVTCKPPRPREERLKAKVESQHRYMAKTQQKTRKRDYRKPSPKPVPKPLQKRKDMGYDALERKENAPVRWGHDTNHQGWILILGAFTPGSLGETAWMRDGILKLLHRNGSASFQIMGDTKARSWRTLGGVKKALERMGE